MRHWFSLFCNEAYSFLRPPDYPPYARKSPQTPHLPLSLNGLQSVAHLKRYSQHGPAETLSLMHTWQRAEGKDCYVHARQPKGLTVYCRPHEYWSLAIKTHRLRRRIEERRVYLTQLREVLSRRWEKPTSIKVTAQVEESPALMGASFDRMEALAKQSEQVIERAERLLRRRQDQMRHHARQRLHSVKQAFEDTDGFT